MLFSFMDQIVKNNPSFAMKNEFKIMDVCLQPIRRQQIELIFLYHFFLSTEKYSKLHTRREKVTINFICPRINNTEQH